MDDEKKESMDGKKERVPHRDVLEMHIIIRSPASKEFILAIRNSQFAIQLKMMFSIDVHVFMHIHL